MRTRRQTNAMLIFIFVALALGILLNIGTAVMATWDVIRPF